MSLFGKRARGGGGDGSDANHGSGGGGVAMPPPASAAPQPWGIQLPFFVTHVGVPGKFTVKVKGFTGDPLALVDASKSMGDHFRVSDKVPTLEGKSFPLWTRGKDGQSLQVHLARYGEAGSMESKFYHLSTPYIFTRGQHITLESKIGAIASDFQGPARLINVTLKPNTWEQKEERVEKYGAVGHKIDVHAAAIEPMASHRGILSLAEEIAAWWPAQARLLPPIFTSDALFAKAKEAAAGDETALAAIEAAESAQTARHAAFAKPAMVVAASPKLVKKADVKKDLGAAVAPVPDSCILIDINRVADRRYQDTEAFDARYMLPDQALVGKETARARSEVAVLDAPDPGHHIRFTVPEKGEPTVDLGASYRLLVGQTVGPSLATEAPEYERELYGVGFGSSNKNQLYSEAFVTLRMPFAPLVDVLLACPTPAFGRVPLQLVVRPEFDKSRALVENTLEEFTKARQAFYPNGFHGGHVQYVSPRVAEFLRYKCVPISHKTARAHFTDFDPAMMYGGKSVDDWVRLAFSTFDKKKIVDTYYEATPDRNDGFWWLTTYRGGASGKIPRILQAGPNGENDDEKLWDVYALVAYKMGDDEVEGLFEDDERLIAAGVPRELVSQRITIKTPADGDRFIKQQLIKRYLERPAKHQTKQLVEHLKSQGMDGIEKVWTDPQLWLQPPSDKMPAHTMPLFLIGAVPRRPKIEVEEEKEEKEEKEVQSPPKKARSASGDGEEADFDD